MKDEKLNRVTVCDSDTKGAQNAILHGECIARRNGTALCAIKPETGRNHQIRVQMSHAGAPLWGDNRYGSGIPGQQIALWGYKLTLTHPTTRKTMTFMDLPCGSIWNTFAPELREIAERFANSAASILTDKEARDAGATPPTSPEGGEKK